MKEEPQAGMNEKVAIVGVGQTHHVSRRLEVNQVELVNEAVRAALEDASLTIKDIDAVIIGNMELFEGNYHVDMWMVDGDGAYLKSGMKVTTGGTTGASVATSSFEHAATGLFNAVLAIGYEKQDEGSSTASLRSVTDDIFYDVGGGALGVGSAMAEIANDMLRRKSVNEEQIAKLRVQQSENGSKNPYAHLRKRLTVDEVSNSKILVAPALRLLHMCPTSVGACAMVVAPERTAVKTTPKPAWVSDFITWHGGLGNLRGPLIGRGPLGIQMDMAIDRATKKLYQRNGIANPRQELDVVEIYDPCTWMLAQFMESGGLCAPNGVGKLIDEGATALEGDIPVNPSGGVTCTNAIGSSAMLRIAECALQLRGDAGEHQVRGAKTGLAIACGGDDYVTVVLLKDRV
jgi:acetyl-CoA C-acetyltransferase